MRDVSDESVPKLLCIPYDLQCSLGLSLSFSPPPLSFFLSVCLLHGQQALMPKSLFSVFDSVSQSVSLPLFLFSVFLFYFIFYLS